MDLCNDHSGIFSTGLTELGSQSCIYASIINQDMAIYRAPLQSQPVESIHDVDVVVFEKEKEESMKQEFRCGGA